MKYFSETALPAQVFRKRGTQLVAFIDAVPRKCLSPPQGLGKKHWTEPAVLTVNSVLHRVALCRKEQWALQVQSS